MKFKYVGKKTYHYSSKVNTQQSVPKNGSKNYLFRARKRFMSNVATEPNNPKLKLAIARMLPNEIQCLPIVGSRTGGYHYYWTDRDYHVRETEWLYIVSLVEQQLSESEQERYCSQLHICGSCDYRKHHLDLAFATFNQRATALCRVKGITIE